MDRRGLGLLLALLLSGCAPETTGLSGDLQTSLKPSQPTEVEQQQLEKADDARAKGDFSTALGIFQDILAENPTITTAYLGMGDIYLQLKAYEQAEPAFAKAVRLEPRNFDAQMGHGMALHALDRFADAVRAFHRALTIEPDDPEANEAIATSYLQMDMPESALVFAQKAVELDPESGVARSNLGAIYEMLGRNREAIDQYVAAMELMPPSPPLMMNLVNVLSKEKRYAEVVNVAENLLKIERSANAYERMGYAYFRMRDAEASARAYRQAVEIDPEHWQAWNGIGVNALNRWLLSKKRDQEAFIEARDAFRRSLQINPDQQKVITLMSNYGL